ncbi:MAG: DNA polymerase III subunit gamma and tau, partial [Streptosporangiaceae bacterium]
MAGDVPSPSPAPAPGADAQPAAAAAPLALYRRYRPATFAEVKGQEHVTEPLRQALRSGRVHHAYLFSGPRGCGKTSSARILARSLNCEQGPTPDPCGSCASCVALAPAGPGSIDVIEIDAASHGGVDDARDLRERAFYAPVSGRFKIYIIDEAHMVTREGFNALLKLVEEPPPHLKFVFATTEPEKVISTIRSRTHHYPFRLVPPAVLRELLEEILASEKVSYEPAVLPVVIRAGAGSVRDSLSVLDQLIAGSDESGLRYDRAVALLGYTDDALIDEVTSAFAAGDGAAVFRAIDKVVEGGHDPRRFAADLLDRLRDLIVFAAVPDAAATGLLDVPPDRLARMSEQAAELGQAQLVSAAETISAGLVEMRGATSPRLQLELMCAQVLLPAPGSRERDLLARLERLEHRLASGGVAIPPATAPAPSGRAGAAAAPAAPDTPPGPDTAGPSERGADAARAAVADAARTRAAPGPARGAPGPDGEPNLAGRRSGDPQAAPADSRPDAPSAPAAAGAPAAASAPAATCGGSGPVTAAMIRDRWADVLAAVRQQRKVAWILLSNAAVGDLTENVLTLNFGQAGEARGFSASGYDGDLAGVLQALFGISPQICAIFGAPPGQAGTGPRPPRGTGQDDPGPGPGGPEADARPAERPGPGSPGSGRAGGARGDDADEAGPSRSGSGPAGPGGSRPGPGQGPGAAGSGPPGARRPGRRDG